MSASDRCSAIAKSLSRSPYRGRDEPAPVEAVRGIDLDVAKGEVLGMVGEVRLGQDRRHARRSLGLLPEAPCVTGSVRFHGEELVGTPERELRKIRGARIAMIFQDPLSSLNPVMTVGAQIAEAIRLHHARHPQSRPWRAR